jgi:hypothetical protein
MMIAPESRPDRNERASPIATIIEIIDQVWIVTDAGRGR